MKQLAMTDISDLPQIPSLTLDLTEDPCYHPPIAQWFEEFHGKTWVDMAGWDEIDQKINFALFRRGLYDPD